MAIAESRDKADNMGGEEIVSDCNMDVSGGGGAGDDKDNGNLYETLEMIDEGAKNSVSSEAEPESEINSPIYNVKFEVEVSSVGENTDIGGGDTKSACDIATDSVGAPTDGDSESGGSVINIDSGIEMDKDNSSNINVDGTSGGGDTNKSVKANPSDSVGAISGVSIKSVSKSGCAGDVIGAIPRVSRTRLREIFQHAEGEFIN